jgi:hypothetical protein
MEIKTIRLAGDPVAVSSAYTIEAEGSGSQHPQKVAQAALRHLRVWLMRKYAKGRRANVARSRAPPAGHRQRGALAQELAEHLGRTFEEGHFGVARPG